MLTCVIAAGTLLAADTAGVLKPGIEAPPFSLPTLDGKREALRVWCGDTLLKPHINNVKHTVIVNFWATYCKPCQKEIPELSAFIKKHAGEPISAFCISIDKEGADIVKPFVEEKGYDVPVLLDPYAKTAERYGVKSVPALFVIAPSGHIQYSAMGFDEKTNLGEKLEKVLADIKAGKKAAGGAGVEVNGEHVAVQAAAAPGSAAPSAPIAASARWKAVARVECGEKVEDVARELATSPDSLRAWYKNLKQAALSLWPKGE
jgi:thiol-disulfide isomerase/thioredoxin